MFDCVSPTRDGRNGTIWTRAGGRLNIKRAEDRTDASPLGPDRDCYNCRTYARAYLRPSFIAGESLSMRLLTLHNLSFPVDLAARARRAIQEGRYAEWSAGWLAGFRERGGAARGAT